MPKFSPYDENGNPKKEIFRHVQRMRNLLDISASAFIGTNCY